MIYPPCMYDTSEVRVFLFKLKLTRRTVSWQNNVNIDHHLLPCIPMRFEVSALMHSDSDDRWI